MTPTELALSKFVREEILRDGSTPEIRSDLALIESGILDSLGLQQLVGFLERQFDIELDDDHLVPENFATIGAIAQLVDSIRD